MNNLEFQNFKEENGHGSAAKYIKNKNNTYESKNIKSKVFALSDWKQRSENFIAFSVYDIGKGDFVNVGNLNIELNKDN